MKYILLLILFFLFLQKTYADYSYPIKEMSKVQCRFNDFSSLSSDCKMTLPILKTSEYSKYKNDYSLYRRVYTVLWWSSYTYWWDLWFWWHSWLDIATSKWTPVFPMTNWKVIVASFLAWRWNTVKVEHTINGKKIYSNYSHLSKINVSVWDNVDTNTILWEVWSTWNSHWNHLHFQIDLTDSKWPWYRKNCSVKDYNSIVNWWACFAELNQNTIDPLLFLETSWAVIKQSTIVSVIDKVQTISKEWLISREEILRREIQEFFKNYNISIWLTNFWWNTTLKTLSNFRIKITDKKFNKPFSWSLPWSLNFKFNSSEVDIFPSWILAIDKWFRDFTVIPKRTWKITIWVYVWEIFLKNVSFWVFDDKKSIFPSWWAIFWQSKIVSWDIWKWIFVFNDKSKINLIWIKFAWKYKIISTDKDMFFCIKKVNSMQELIYKYNTNCDFSEFKKEIEFDYNSSINWIFIFNYIKSWESTSAINIENTKNENIISKNISSIKPKWIDKNYIYFDEVNYLLNLWIVSWLKDNYILQDRQLSEYDLKIMLLKRLYYKNDIQKVNDLLSYKADKYKFLTRLQTLDLITKYTVLLDYSWEYIKYRDIKEEQNLSIKNIFKQNTWKDNFWKSYFQPDKTITRWEWMYMIYNLIKK